MVNSYAQKFLHDASQKWPRTPEKSLESLSPSDRQILRSMEETIQRGQYEILTDLVANCDNKFAFAKQYMVFKNGSALSGAPAGVSPELTQAVRDLCVTHAKALLRFMADWFYIKWGNPDDPIFRPTRPGDFVMPDVAIERCASSIPRVGCPILTSLVALVVFVWLWASSPP